MTTQLIDRFNGVKTSSAEVTLHNSIKKTGFCTLYKAHYQDREVIAHICDLTVASTSNVPSVEQVRCLYTAVQFNFLYERLVTVIALATDPKSNPILLYENYSNGTLDEYVKSNKNLSEKELISLCKDVCDGKNGLGIWKHCIKLIIVFVRHGISLA